MRGDFKQLEAWAHTWGMRLNAKKCYILTVSEKGIQKFYELNDHILKEIDNNPYLGVILSKDLKWSTHIDQICKIGSSTLGFVQRNLKSCPKECKKALYFICV